MKTIKLTLRVISILTMTLLGLASCKKEQGSDNSNKNLKIEIVSASDGNLNFKLSYEGAEPSLYVYHVTEKGQYLSSQEIYDQGTKSVPKADYSISKLEVGKEYVLNVTAQLESGLCEPAYADFVSTAFAPSSDDAIELRIDKVTHNSLTYSLTSGLEVMSGKMAVYPKAFMDNYIYEFAVDGITEDDVIIDFMLQGYGVDVIGEELYTNWTSTPIWPEADYCVYVLAMLEGNEPGKLTKTVVTSASIGLVGDPTLTIEMEDCSYMTGYFKYTINSDSYGYMRFITNKSEIDEYLEHFTEDDLREFVRFMDGTWENLNQRWDLMEPSTDGGKTKSKMEAINFGWEAGGLEFTALGVAFDKNMTASKKLARLDGKLKEVPEGTPKAEFTCEPVKPSATTLKLHFELGETCAKAYCALVEGKVDEPYTYNDLTQARDLWYGGWVMYRESLDPNAPLVNNEDIQMDLAPNTDYHIVATGINFDGVLNEEIYVSKSISTKSLSFDGSEAVIELGVEEVGKLSATISYKCNDKTVEYYHIIMEADDQTIVSKPDAEIVQYLFSKGNRWAWYGNSKMDPDYDDEKEAVLWTWNDFTPGKEYVVLAAAQDTEGRVSGLYRNKFTTKPLTPGPNPDVTLNIYDKTTNSVKVDIIPNDDVAKYRYVLVEEGLVPADPSNEDEFEEALYDFTMVYGTDGYEPLKGVLADKLPEGGTFYLAVIAYGEGKNEKFTYEKIQLSGYGAAVLSSSADFGDVKIIAGGEAKSFEAMKAANLRIERNLMNEDGVIYVYGKEDAERVLNGMGYTMLPMKEAIERTLSAQEKK